MTEPGERMRTILNSRPTTVKVRIPCKEIRINDLFYGDAVTRIEPDEFFVHFWTQGKPYPQGFYPDYYIEVERKIQ